jgi:hypothetical protein
MPRSDSSESTLFFISAVLPELNAGIDRTLSFSFDLVAQILRVLRCGPDKAAAGVHRQVLFLSYDQHARRRGGRHFGQWVGTPAALEGEPRGSVLPGGAEPGADVRTVLAAEPEEAGRFQVHQQQQQFQGYVVFFFLSFFFISENEKKEEF